LIFGPQPVLLWTNQFLISGLGRHEIFLALAKATGSAWRFGMRGLHAGDDVGDSPFGASAMSSSDDEDQRNRAASRIPGSNRYNFDPPLSDTSWRDWQPPRVPEWPSAENARGHYEGAQRQANQAQRHKPAPMQRRQELSKANRAPKRDRNNAWTMLIIGGALIGLTSFGIAYDISSEGKLKRFIAANLPKLPEQNSDSQVGDSAEVGQLPSSHDDMRIATAPEPMPKPAQVQSPLPAPIPPNAAKTPAAPVMPQMTEATPPPLPPNLPAIVKLPDSPSSSVTIPKPRQPEEIAMPQVPPPTIQKTAKPTAPETLAAAPQKPLTKVTPPAEPLDPPKLIAPPPSLADIDKPQPPLSEPMSPQAEKMTKAMEPKFSADIGELKGKASQSESDLPEKKQPGLKEQSPPAPAQELRVAMGPVKQASESATAKPSTSVPKKKNGDAFKDCADCPELVVVSAGEFLKRTDENPNEPPKLESISRDFAIARHEVTFDDWDRCVADGACEPIAQDGGWGRGKRPVIFVSYGDITQQYLPWLSRISGKAYRLPDEEEWEFASVGGAGAPSGGAETACSNISGNSIGKCADQFTGTAPVGSFNPNGLGLHDMIGNVWEWVDDCWEPFNYASAKVSLTCENRIVLGGAWSTQADIINPQIEGWEKKDKRRNSIGFRVARSLP
jgi:formylglycine-generating enzyme required for sulfatase activity